MIASIRSVSLFSAALTAAIAGGAALADEPTDSAADFDHRVPTVSNAFELTAGMGYTQGTGDISEAGVNVADISGAGATFELKAGYRISPSFAFGGYGSFAKFTKANLAEGTDVLGATAGLWGDYHFRPDRSIDPVIGIASGFRGMWLSPEQGKRTSLIGWEVARLQASFDYRVTPEVAVGPYVGASINTFFTESSPATNGFEDISSPRANFFFYAGLQGRFDIAGERQAHGDGQAEQARN